MTIMLLRSIGNQIMKSKVLSLSFTIIYITFLMYVVFFARRRRHMTERFLNLVPIKNAFNEFIHIGTNEHNELYNFCANILGNIALFIPLHASLILVFKIKNSKIIFFMSFFLTVLIEAIQYTFKIGVADIDDILLNTLGATLGIFIVRKKGFCAIIAYFNSSIRQVCNHTIL